MKYELRIRTSSCLHQSQAPSRVTTSTFVFIHHRDTEGAEEKQDILRVCAQRAFVEAWRAAPAVESDALCRPQQRRYFCLLFWPSDIIIDSMVSNIKPKAETRLTALRRGFTVLRLVAQARCGCTFTELCRAVGNLSPASLARLLKVMTAAAREATLKLGELL